MTLLGAAIFDGYVVFGADQLTAETDSTDTIGVWTLRDKGHRVLGFPHVKMGWAGSGRIGDPIRTRLDRVPSCAWEDLQSALVRITVDENKAHPDEPRTDCLIAGYVNGVPGILYAKWDGDTRLLTTPENPSEPDAFFVGTAMYAIAYAWIVSKPSTLRTTQPMGFAE